MPTILPRHVLLSVREDQFDTLEVVPEKSAPFAIIMPPLWLAWHGLWFALGVYGLVVVFITALLATDYWMVSLVPGGLPGIYLFFEGHQLRRNQLQAHGYRLVEVIDARDERTALARYVSATLAPTDDGSKQAVAA